MLLLINIALLNTSHLITILSYIFTDFKNLELGSNSLPLMTSPTVLTQVPPSLNTTVILAGGIGVRLKTVHNEAPKGLLEIDGKAII